MAPLYRLNIPNARGLPRYSFDAYARAPNDIIDLVIWMQNEVRKQNDGRLNVSELNTWGRRVPELNEIMVVKSAKLFLPDDGIYQDLTSGIKPDFIEIGAADDFTVYVNRKNLKEFDGFVRNPRRLRRGNLYEILRGKVDLLYPGVTFVPEDVMFAMRDFDLTPYINKPEARKPRKEAVVNLGDDANLVSSLRSLKPLPASSHHIRSLNL